jgi:hypothetical protein
MCMTCAVAHIYACSCMDSMHAHTREHAHVSMHIGMHKDVHMEASRVNTHTHTHTHTHTTSRTLTASRKAPITPQKQAYVWEALGSCKWIGNIHVDAYAQMQECAEMMNASCTGPANISCA